MDRVFLILILSLKTFYSFCQNEELIYFNSPQSENIFDISYIEENESYVFILDECKLSPNNINPVSHYYNSRQVIYSLNNDLNLTDSLILEEIDGFKIRLYGIHQTESDTIIIHGSAYDSVLADMQICLLWLDYSLNIIKDTLMGHADKLDYPGEVLVNYSNNIVFHGQYDPPGFNGSKKDDNIYFFWEIDKKGNEVQFVIDSNFVGGGLVPLGSSGKYFVYKHPYRIRLNPDFSVDTSFEFDVLNLSIWHNKFYQDNQYLSLCEYFQGLNPINPNIADFDIAVLPMDNGPNIPKFFTYGTLDTTDRHGDFDFYYLDTIFVGATKHVMIDPVDNWFVLYKTNLNGDIFFDFFYGGYGKYSLHNVLATKDGGCIITGTWWDFYNYPDTLKQYDAVIIKVDANGFISNLDEHIPFEVTGIIVYPNPGNDFIKINTALKNLVFTLFDIKGNIVAEKDFDKSTFINTQHLQAGIYLYKIQQFGKEVKSGKWIKQ